MNAECLLIRNQLILTDILLDDRGEDVRCTTTVRGDDVYSPVRGEDIFLPATGSE